MSDDKKTAIKLRHISIRNYKGIDSLDLDFPEPLMSGDPDVLVMGSENGLGKTSVLECCALLLLGATLADDELIDLHTIRIHSNDIPSLVIRADAEYAYIEGLIQSGDVSEKLHITIRRDGFLRSSVHNSRQGARISESKASRDRRVEKFLRAIWGFSPEPACERTCIALNSYRKVQEGSIEIASLVEKNDTGGTADLSRVLSSTSTVKFQMLRSLMSKANLFEISDGLTTDQEDALEKLNSLLDAYANVTMGKLRPSPDNSFDFLVVPENGGGSYSFDGLSSGQKEIVSTLFSVWFHTNNSPMVVLIDEPELHLNAQWHRKFVRTLFSIAPDNQYIMATHSEFIMGSVDPDRRVLLSFEPSATV